MGFNEFIGKLFGNKATRDMKEIKPWVDKIKAVYPIVVYYQIPFQGSTFLA